MNSAPADLLKSYVQSQKFKSTSEVMEAIVFTPKYRRKIIFNQYRESIGGILRQLCSYKGVEILESHLMPDHVHMLVSIPPKISVSSFMGYLKGKSALMIFDKHANLKTSLGIVIFGQKAIM